nr:hypothetical protein [Tanacetum cinerariifolium]
MSGADILSQAEPTMIQIIKRLNQVFVAVAIMVSLWLSSSELTDYAYFPAAIEITVVLLFALSIVLCIILHISFGKLFCRDVKVCSSGVPRSVACYEAIDHNYTYAVSNPNGSNPALQFVESAESDIERTALLRPVSRETVIGNTAIAMGMVKYIKLEMTFAMLAGWLGGLQSRCIVARARLVIVHVGCNS